MRAVFVGALVALAGAFVFAGPKPASALPATAAINYSNTQANGALVEVRHWKRRYYRRPYRVYRYARPYHYYRPYRYSYYRPYYWPYYRPYHYYRRPSVGVWIGW
jgi:hypothetical protein